MTMTRKDFEALAETIRCACPRLMCPDNIPDAYRRAWIDGAMTAWDEQASMIADFCEHQNPRFDRRRFLQACRPAGL